MLRKKAAAATSAPQYDGAIIIEVDGAIHNIHRATELRTELENKSGPSVEDAFFFPAPVDPRPQPDSYTGLPNSNYDVSYSIYITNVDFLRITLEILSQNNILCILAASRRKDCPNLREHLFTTMDSVFGPDRIFLKKEHTLLIHNDTHSKFDMQRKVLAIPGCDKLEGECRLFVDESDDRGITSIHVSTTRNGKPDDPIQNTYLFEMLRLLSIPAIYTTLNNTPIPDNLKIAFKVGLLSFHMSQVTVLGRPSSLAAAISEENAEALLRRLEAVILHTKWDMSFGGGKKVNNNVVSKKMLQMLREISAAHQGKKNYIEALRTIIDIAKKACQDGGPGYVGSRYPTTSLFYKSVEELSPYACTTATSAAAAPAAEAVTPHIQAISFAKAQLLVKIYQRNRAGDKTSASKNSTATCTELLVPANNDRTRFNIVQKYMLNSANVGRRFYRTVLDYYTLSDFMPRHADAATAAARKP
jgi:hypothetical protein